MGDGHQSINRDSNYGVDNHAPSMFWYLYLYLHISIYQSSNLSIYPYLYLHLYYIYIRFLTVSISIHPSTYLYPYLHLYLYLYLCIYTYTHIHFLHPWEPQRFPWRCLGCCSTGLAPAGGASRSGDSGQVGENQRLAAGPMRSVNLDRWCLDTLCIYIYMYTMIHICTIWSLPMNHIFTLWYIRIYIYTYDTLNVFVLLFDLQGAFFNASNRTHLELGWTSGQSKAAGVPAWTGLWLERCERCESGDLERQMSWMPRGSNDN
jgi:hypothetical protein